MLGLIFTSRPDGLISISEFAVLTLLIFATGYVLLFIALIRWASERLVKCWPGRIFLCSVAGLFGFCLAFSSYLLLPPFNREAWTLLIKLACGGLLISLILWGFAPLRLPARLVLSSFVGLGALCLAVSTNMAIFWWDWWDGLFQSFFLRLVTNTAVASVFQAAHHPEVYLVGAWGLGFIVTFHLLGLRRKRTDQPDKPDDSEQ